MDQWFSDYVMTPKRVVNIFQVDHETWREGGGGKGELREKTLGLFVPLNGV